MTQTTLRSLVALTFLSMWNPASGAIWIEPRDSDAGAFVPGAQYPVGVGTLDGIQGVLEGGADFGQPDYQDLFAIFISDPVNFSATTVTLGGGADVNTNLWLFSTAELGLLGNLDYPGGGQFSRLTPIANDGSFALTVPGIYFIGVSGNASVPTSVAGNIFHFVTPTELSGPDGPGGTGVHDNWSGAVETGVYFIELTGVSFVPAPGAALMLALGAAASFRRRR